MENDQANTLASGNVSKYALAVNWSQLAARESTPEPQPTGYSNRWYVTPLELGQGVKDAEGTEHLHGPHLPRARAALRGVRPNHLQPVHAHPPDLDPALARRPTSTSTAPLAPSQLQEECEDRDSICATTEGFSDGGWYFGPAQVDFWDVWHQLAQSYDLDPDATVISGYSMGGFASYKLALEYPDLFAQAMPLEGPVVCGEKVTGGVETAAGPGQCTSDGNTTPLIVNGKWIPYVMTYGALDELVPFTGGVEQVEAFNKLGYRYYAVLYPAEDHLVFATQNDFAPADDTARTSRKSAQSRLVHVHLVSGRRLAVAGHRAHRRLLGQRPGGAQLDAGQARDRASRLGRDLPEPARRPNITPRSSTDRRRRSPTR